MSKRSSPRSRARAWLGARVPRLDRFLRLVRRHHRLLISTWFLLIGIRIALWVSSYRPVLNRIRALQGSRSAGADPVLLTWAVVHASRVVPRATCLVQALALRYLLARAGQPGCIRIGVAEDDTGKFEAHAWVQYHDRILIGALTDRIERFVPIVDL